MTYTLSPVDVMELRATVRWHLTTANSLLVPKPFIIYCREEPMTMNAPGYDPEAFAIYVNSHLYAITPRPEVAAACLRAEYAEPGFMSRIMNPAEDCERAVLDPDARLAEQRRRAFEAKAAREYAEERAREMTRAGDRARQTPRPQADPGAFQLDLD